MNSEKNYYQHLPIDMPVGMERNLCIENHHHGVLLERVVRRAPIGISEIARKMNISRRTIYNWFETEKISLHVIRKIGDIVGYDFSVDLPEEFLTDELQGIGHNLTQAPYNSTSQNSAVYYWMDRYIKLLEDVNKTLLNGKNNLQIDP